MEFDVQLAPGAHQAVYVAVPFHDPDALLGRVSGAGAEAEFQRAFEATTRDWRRLLSCVDFSVPPAARDLLQTAKTHARIHPDQPQRRCAATRPAQLQPLVDPRRAMISAALLEMGFTAGGARLHPLVRRHFRMPNGKVPCCVDRHGADALPEHDSNGEFLYAIAEYYRYTRDIGFVNELWPNARQAVDYIATLRTERLTDAYKTPSKRAFYGLLPESVEPRGLRSRTRCTRTGTISSPCAVSRMRSCSADAVGERGEAARIAALRDGLQRDLHASIAR